MRIVATIVTVWSIIFFIAAIAAAVEGSPMAALLHIGAMVGLALSATMYGVHRLLSLILAELRRQSAVSGASRPPRKSPLDRRPPTGTLR
jgi:uncharacterized membrane protein